MVSLLMMILILAACGGGDAAPTSEVSSDPTIDASTFTETPPDFIEQRQNELNATEEVIDEDGNIIIVTPQAIVQDGVVPLPGTLAYDPEFVDENMGAVFDRIVFSRSSAGGTSDPYRLVLFQNGLYDLNKEIVGQVNGSTVTRIDDILDEINFFAINTPMLGPGGESANYRYVITVERGDDQMTIRAEDGFTPQPVMKLIGALVGVIVDSSNTEIATVTPSP